ncbi:MAG: 30S ribosome-binding factor RbfA [Prosthecobacter sp.]|nr:30S ribosome-binding factor RbfA [Prosthecobacter sp.]
MSQRLDRVNELMKRELSTVLERYYRFDEIVLTIHEVVTAPDLRQASVWVGILGKARDEAGVIEKLNREKGAIQRELYKRVKLKHSPQLLFRLDKTVERAVSLINTLDALPPPLPDDQPHEAP